MKSALPKVLQPFGGQPMVFHLLDRLLDVAPHQPIALIVGHGKEQVVHAVRNSPRFSRLQLTFVDQTEQRGTGHAARCLMQSDWGKTRAAANESVLILPGDQPLLTNELLEPMGARMPRGAAIRILTTVVKDPQGYGRIVRTSKNGPVTRIVEQKDANQREKAIHEIATSIYTFSAKFLASGVDRLTTKNAQGEYYLTDLVAQASQSKKLIEVVQWAEASDLVGINDPWDLAQAQELLKMRTVKKLALGGAKFVDPSRVLIDATVEIEPDVVIYPGAVLQGSTHIASGTIVGPNVVLKNMIVKENVILKVGTVAEDSTIEAGATIGPYAHLRPESVVGAESKIGNFVELKKAKIGKKTSISHLSYLGDAVVGDRVNIGCGFVTCNFDGREINGSRKHKTMIEDDVFMGSDCQVVAPIKIGKGSFVASGSTITEDVPSDALAIARCKQTNKPDYAKKIAMKKK